MTPEARLGWGGTAEVFKGMLVPDRSVLPMQPVAIKVLRPECRGERVAVARLRREGGIGLDLSGSAHVVQVFAWGEDDELGPWVVMERMVESLRQRLEGGALPADDAIRIAGHMVDGLRQAHVHPRRIQHRDVKPSNVLFDRFGDAKLADFGSAVHLGAEDLTSPATFIGTFPYASPEQLAGKETTPQTDLFSMAATIAEMLSGQRLFAGDLRAQHSREWVETELAARGLSASVREALGRALDPDPRRRGDLRRLSAALRGVGVGLDDTATAETLMWPTVVVPSGGSSGVSGEIMRHVLERIGGDGRRIRARAERFGRAAQERARTHRVLLGQVIGATALLVVLSLLLHPAASAVGAVAALTWDVRLPLLGFAVLVAAHHFGRGPTQRLWQRRKAMLTQALRWIRAGRPALGTKESRRGVAGDDHSRGRAPGRRRPRWLSATGALVVAALLVAGVVLVPAPATSLDDLGRFLDEQRERLRDLDSGTVAILAAAAVIPVMGLVLRFRRVAVRIFARVIPVLAVLLAAGWFFAPEAVRYDSELPSGPRKQRTISRDAPTPDGPRTTAKRSASGAAKSRAKGNGKRRSETRLVAATSARPAGSGRSAAAQSAPQSSSTGTGAAGPTSSKRSSPDCRCDAVTSSKSPQRPSGRKSSGSNSWTMKEDSWDEGSDDSRDADEEEVESWDDGDVTEESSSTESELSSSSSSSASSSSGSSSSSSSVVVQVNGG